MSQVSKTGTCSSASGIAERAQAGAVGWKEDSPSGEADRLSLGNRLPLEGGTGEPAQGECEDSVKPHEALRSLGAPALAVFAGAFLF